LRRSRRRRFDQEEATARQEPFTVFAYRLRIVGPDGEVYGDLDLDCDTDLEAIRVAALAESPYGHGLWRGDQMLGWFDPTPAETDDD
jgi:hypothetical protein